MQFYLFFSILALIHQDWFLWLWWITRESTAIAFQIATIRHKIKHFNKTHMFGCIIVCRGSAAITSTGPRFPGVPVWGCTSPCSGVATHLCIAVQGAWCLDLLMSINISGNPQGIQVLDRALPLSPIYILYCQKSHPLHPELTAFTIVSFPEWQICHFQTININDHDFCPSRPISLVERTLQLWRACSVGFNALDFVW